MDSPTISVVQLLVTAVSLWSQQTVEDRPFARKNRSAPLGHLQKLAGDCFRAVQCPGGRQVQIRSAARAQLPHTAAKLASQQGAQGHPVRIADVRGDLVDAFGAVAQQMHSTLDAQVLEVRQW